MLFEAPGANQFLSAAILDPETLYQKRRGSLLARHALLRLAARQALVAS